MPQHFKTHEDRLRSLGTQLEVTYLIRCFACGDEQREEAEYCPQDEDQLTPPKVAQLLLQEGWRYGYVGSDEGWFCGTCFSTDPHHDEDPGECQVLDEVPEELLQ